MINKDNAEHQTEITGLTLPLCGFKVIESTAQVHDMQIHHDRVALITGTGDLSNKNKEPQERRQGRLASIYLFYKRFIKAVFSGDPWFSH